MLHHMRMPHAHRCSTVCRCSQVLQAKIDLLARCERAVPTALAAPLLDMLHTEVEQLEKVLEVDTSQGASYVLFDNLYDTNVSALLCRGWALAGR